MRNKNEEFFIKAYDDYSDAIFRFCYFKTGDKELATDLAEQAFMKLWDYLQTEGEVLNAKAFLYGVSRNMVIDWYRKKKEVSADSLYEGGFDPPDESSGGDSSLSAEIKNMLKLMKGLSDGDREILTLRYVEGLKIGEIAEIVKESENSVSVRINRAINKLREFYE